MAPPHTEDELKEDLSITKRIVNKFHSSHVTQDANNHHHRKTEEYVGAGARSVVEEIFQALAGKEAMAVISNVVLTQAQLISKQATSDESRKAARVSAQEAFTGSYDAVERKWDEWFKDLPTYYMLGAGVAGGLAALLVVGLLLAIWRFVLFGLGPIF